MSIIDLLNMSREDQSLLIKLISSHADGNPSKILLHSTRFSIEDQEVKLSNTIIINYSTDVAETSVYISGRSKLGTGSSSWVYPIENYFIITRDDQIQFQDYDQSLVVKIEKRSFEDDFFSSSSSSLSKKTKCHQALNKEVKNLTSLQHTGFVLCASQEQRSCIMSAIILKKQPGMELFDLLDAMMRMDYISSQFRLSCSIALLVAYEKQLHECRFIHGDIKPENIKVDLAMSLDDFQDQNVDAYFSPPCLNINFIDYASSRSWDDADGVLCEGSEFYRSPESQWDNRRELYMDETIDMYSLGKILFILWGFAGGIDFSSNKRIYFNCLFAQHHDYLDISLFEVISSFVLKLFSEEPAKRPKLQETLAFFREQQAKNDLNTVPVHELVVSGLFSSACTIDPSPQAVAELNPTPDPAVVSSSPIRFNPTPEPLSPRK